MLIDSELLPTYKKALDNDPEAVFKIANAYKLGQGAPKNHIIAHEWYEKLLSFEDLPFVEYEYCYALAGTAAYDRKEYQLAFQRYNESLKLFVRKYGVETGFDKMNAFEFFDTYHHIKLLAQAGC